MNVGLMIYGDINILSGGYLYDRKLVEHLESQGDRVEILSLEKSGYCKSLLKQFDPVSLNGRHIDILLQDELIHPSVVVTNRKIKERYGIPIISLVHLLSSAVPGQLLKNAIIRKVEQAYLASIDGLVLNSRHTLEQTRKLLGDKLPENIVAVPAGNNFDSGNIQGKRSGRNDDILKLLYVGSVIRQKGLETLLHALDILKNPMITLTVCGRTDMEPDYSNQMLSLVRNLGLQEQITFAGPVEHRQLADYYQAHDVMVLPSVNEAYGIVYIEAMGFGMPVIGTAAGGAGEIIQHQENGYLIKPGDYRQLSGYINALFGNRGLLTQLGESAFSAYQSHPVWVDSCSVIRDFLLSVIKKNDHA